MKTEEFFLPCDGMRVHSKLTVPEDGRDRFPLCIIVHGFTGHMEEEHILAVEESVLSLGMASLRVDLYGHGQSSGEFRDHNLLLWLAELVRVIEYASALPCVSELYLAGHSQGGAAIVLAGAIMAEKLTALLPLAPATLIRSAALNNELFGTTFPSPLPDLLQADFSEEETLTLHASYLRVNRLLPFGAAAKEFRGPVLLVHSDTDETVPYACSEDLAALYENAELITLHGCDHCFTGQLDALKQAVSKFLRRVSEKLPA